MSPKSRSHMELFVEKAELLKQGSYYKSICENGIKMTFELSNGKDVVIDHNFPEGETLQAMLLTFRMFLQNKDHVSLHSMTGLLDDPGVSQAWKDRFNFVRLRVNAGLDMTNIGGLPIVDKGEVLTPRKILSTYIYGKWAHAYDNEDHARYKEWENNPTLFVVTQRAFTFAAFCMIEAMYALAQACRCELPGEPMPPIP